MPMSGGTGNNFEEEEGRLQGQNKIDRTNNPGRAILIAGTAIIGIGAVAMLSYDPDAKYKTRPVEAPVVEHSMPSQAYNPSKKERLEAMGFTKLADGRFEFSGQEMNIDPVYNFLSVAANVNPWAISETQAYNTLDYLVGINLDAPWRNSELLQGETPEARIKFGLYNGCSSMRFPNPNSEDFQGFLYRQDIRDPLSRGTVSGI